MASKKKRAKAENINKDVEVLPPDDVVTQPLPPLPIEVDSSSGEAGLVSVSPLQRYLNEIRRFPLLTREQEQQIAERYFTTGDPQSAYRLVVSNLRLVVKIAMEFRRAFVNVLDLIQEGNIGLMQAVSKYDPYKGVKLSSYAAWWIKAYILRYILNNWRLVKAGTTQAQRKLFYNLQREKERLLALGIDPTPQLIAKRLDVPMADVVEMQQRMDKPEVSLEAPLSDEGRGTIQDLIPAAGVAPDDVIEKIDRAEKVSGLIEEFGLGLSDKESFIFRHRMLAEEPLTLQEIGAEFGISRERVRQLEKKLMSRLKEFMLQNGFEY